MKKLRMRLKSLLLPLFGLFLATNLIFASTPVMADPEEPTTSESSTETGSTCYDQLGAVSWILCPVITASSTAIDSLYDIISNFLVVKPITSDTESPIYIVWEYARNITNIVFIIFLIISIYSQITGLGISNYGVKRVLPRIIISALLVNLSFIVCAVAVDVSNVLGVSLLGFFESVRDSAVGSGVTNGTLTFTETLTLVVGGGAVTAGAVAAGAAVAGGVGALFWLLIPVIIGALIAVVISVITIILRQGVVAILIMIAPLAFVAYLLPNTEKYFGKWRDLLVRMLIFYPAFSILFGASNLAGWVLISSANGDLFWMVVGLAVQFIPLFLAWPLMKMSGTVLGTVNDKLRQLSQPGVNKLRGYSDERRQLSRSRYLANNDAKRYNLPHRTAQFLDKRKYKRAAETARLQEVRKSQNEAYANQILNKRGQLTAYGERAIRADVAKSAAASELAQNQMVRDNVLLDSNNYRNSRQAARIAKLNERHTAAKDSLSDINSVSRQLQLEEISDRYRRSHNAVMNNTNQQFSARYAAMQEVAGSTGQRGINSILSGAIAAQAKASKEALGDYESLYESAVFSSEIYDEVDAAFNSKNPIALRASLSVLANRGEYDTVTKKLREHTDSINSTSPEDRAMQQAIQDVMFSIKVADTLKGYGKAIAKGRNKGNAINNNLPDGATEYATFIPYSEYENPYINPDPDHGALGLGIDQATILRTNNNANIAAIQDKTVWDDAKSHNLRLFTPGQIRYAVFNEPTDGETYQYMIDSQLGIGAKWQDKETRRILTFNHVNANPAERITELTPAAALDEAQARVIDIISGINASQLSKFTPDAFEAFATIFSNSSTTAPDGTIIFNNSNETERRQNLVRGIQQLSQYFPDKLVDDLRKQASRGQLSNMNPEIRNILNDVLHFE